MARYFRCHPDDRAKLDELWRRYDAAASNRDVRRTALRERIEDVAATLAIAPYDPGVVRLVGDDYPLDRVR